MSFRALAVYDGVIEPDMHIPAVGGSASLLIAAGGALGFWKVNPRILIGLLHTSPVGQGHDAGPLRGHVLVVVPDPGGISAGYSALATALSSCKPHFTAHKVQIKVDGSMLPICCEVIPIVGLLSTLQCGSPVSTPGVIPIIPSHLSVYVGMTLGDIVGGIVNVVVDMAWSAVTNGVGELLDSSSKLAAKVAGNVLPWAMTGGSVFNLGTGPNNLGAVFQQAIDNDNVASDAEISFKIFGVGAEVKQQSGHDIPTGSDIHFASPAPKYQGIRPWE